MNLRVTIADEINNHAEIAITKANEAMHHAIEAGKLLMEVKAALPHGSFGTWMEANLRVSSRQAQRYMAAAEGKPVPIRDLSSKYDTVSHLTNESEKWKPTPLFIPLIGYRYTTVDAEYVIEPSKAHQGFFFVSHIPGTEKFKATAEFTYKPVRAEWVEYNLKLFGLDNPELANWLVNPNEGVSYALESLGMPTPEKQSEIFNDRPIVKKNKG